MGVMPRHGSSIVRQAIVLAAGNGDRFQHGSPHSAHTQPQSKLLASVRGTPLLIRTLTAAWQVGIRAAHVVLGYDADRVRALAMRCAPRGLRLHFDLNREWHQENGVSVLAARAGLGGGPFALLMGDHLFEARVLRRLLRTPSRSGEALLCIDRQRQRADVIAEGTRVRVEHGRVTAIGKQLEPFDAIDTGLFVCHASVFDALDEARAAGDTTLSAGIRRLAARGLVRGIDIGRACWCDIDTVADLSTAEQLLASSTGPA